MANALGGADAGRVIRFAQEIVRQPSVTGQEGDLARQVARALRESGLSVELTEVAPGRLNVLATLPGVDPQLALLFHAHLDTVPAGNMPDPFSGEIRDGAIHGRGSVDQKGGLAAAAMALVAISEARVPLASSLGLALVIDEESEHRGSMALVESGLRARQAVVTEPSNLRLVIGCKGTLPFQIEVRGKAAHGCRPWLGVNAVRQAMRVVEALDGLTFPQADIPEYGPVQGSLNLGVIAGGRAYNIVPDRCTLSFDRRTVPGEDPAEVLAEIQTVLDGLAAGEPPVASELRVDRPDWHWEPIRRRGLLPAMTPAGAPIRDLIARHHQAAVGSPAELYFTDGYQEMDFLVNDLGISAVQYGPGDNRLCHTDDERLDIEQLVMATQVYIQAALEAASA